jgi:hypothetical protein
MEEFGFSEFDCYLDESDPDTVTLRRQDGTVVKAFSVRGASSEGIVEAAKEDVLLTSPVLSCQKFSLRVWAALQPYLSTTTARSPAPPTGAQAQSPSPSVGAEQKPRGDSRPRDRDSGGECHP